MGWRTLVVNKHSKLTYKNNHLIFKSIDQTEMIHLSEIDLLLCETSDITITTALMYKLIDSGSSIIFCDNKRLPNSSLVPFYGRHDSSLQIQRQINWNEEAKAKVWTEIIRQKIFNQGIYLSYHGFEEKSNAIMNLLAELEDFDPSNREGHAARIFFNTLYGNDFSRETGNSVNVGLDYGYTLIMSMFAREIVKCGCLTQMGLKHSNQFNDFNLASDIMEPFRIIVDEIVYEYSESEF
ncbi:MAG: type II CRISPR-associated endonuclease Cas1, partial [Lachnospiraceae bacterium]|nr:type II CRISPR-associated endonuclease Cas1 [Lachnospiraceae bacterium]